MQYATLSGTKLELQEDLYSDVEIDATIESMDAEKTVFWINGAVQRTSDFTEEELTGDDALIRLASCKYCAYSVMSSVLEGHNIETVSLAKHRLGEAKDIIQMWCNQNGVVPAFDDDAAAHSSCGVEFAYAVGSDSVCIG